MTRRPARVRVDRRLMRRAAWALGRLRAGLRLRATDLAREFEISVRTAYRDLDFLRDDWRVPVAFDRGNGTFRLTEPAALVAPVTLSRGELLAMFFAEKVVRQYRGTSFERDLASALHKIQELLPEDVSVSPDTLDAVLSLDIGPVQTPEATVFAEVLTALRQRRVLAIRYRSLHSNRTSNRRVHPYHVFNHRGDWYVAAWDGTRKAIRDFALHRIRRATITTEPFERQQDFDARAYLGQAFAIEKGTRPVDVVIRFAPRQARWIRERRWHGTARIQEALDGGCVLRLRVAGLGEVRRWVLQFGAEAQVLAPKRLRDDVRQELRRAIGLYRSITSGGL